MPFTETNVAEPSVTADQAALIGAGVGVATVASATACWVASLMVEPLMTNLLTALTA